MSDREPLKSWPLFEDWTPVKFTPYELFAKWIKEAESECPNNSRYMNLASANAVGVPSNRVIQLESFSESGLRFATNPLSPKARDFAVNPHVAACFYWPPKCVRIQGAVSQLDVSIAQEIFDKLPDPCKVAVCAYRQQSTPCTLQQVNQNFKEAESILRQPIKEVPAHYGAYRITAEKFEFSINRPDWTGHRVQFFRLKTGEHTDGEVVHLADDGWAVQLLCP